MISLYRTTGVTLLFVDAAGAVPVCCNSLPLPLPLPLPLSVTVAVTATNPPPMPVDVADDIDVVSGVGIDDVSSDTAGAALLLAASVQHPIAAVTTAVKSSDAPPRPWPVTVDLITQDAPQLSHTGSDGWRGKGRSGRQGCGGRRGRERIPGERLVQLLGGQCRLRPRLCCGGQGDLVDLGALDDACY